MGSNNSFSWNNVIYYMTKKGKLMKRVSACNTKAEKCSEDEFTEAAKNWARVFK
jgi:hypothetical protein